MYYNDFIEGGKRMYRRCMCNMYNKKKQCGCHEESDDHISEDLLEDVCDYVNNQNNASNNNNDCGCGFDDEENAFPSNYMYGNSYVPNQIMNKTFLPCVGLKMGTLFPELVSPYEPYQSIREIDYLKSTNEIGEGCNEC